MDAAWFVVEWGVCPLVCFAAGAVVGFRVFLFCIR
jgi:hypothetical protein